MLFWSLSALVSPPDTTVPTTRTSATTATNVLRMMRLLGATGQPSAGLRPSKGRPSWPPHVSVGEKLFTIWGIKRAGRPETTPGANSGPGALRHSLPATPPLWPGLLTRPPPRPKVSGPGRGNLRSDGGARSGDRAPTG